jgi:hypothetical protein
MFCSYRHTSISIRIISTSGTPGNSERRSVKTHHVGIVRVYTHIRKGVETGHSPEAHMTVQLCEGVVRILAGLHLRQGLRRRSGSRCRRAPSGLGGALHHMDRVSRLDLVV